MSALQHHSHVLVLLLGLVYLATPGHPGAVTDGLPLKTGATIASLVLAAAWFGFGRWIPRRAAVLASGTLLALIALKLGIASAAPDYGLTASYYDNSRFNGRPERSSEYRLPNATRLDRELHFGGDEIPVYFFNDSERFNFFGAGQPQRRQLPFSARWEGVLFVPEDGDYTFRLTASGQGSVDIGAALKLSIDAPGRDTQERSVALRAGTVPVRAEYARRPERSPDFRLDWVRSGVAVPLAAPYLRPNADGPSLQVDRLLHAAAGVIDTLAAMTGLGVLLAAIREGIRLSRQAAGWRARLEPWERPLLSLVPLGFGLSGSLPRLDRVGKMVYLGGGQDWLLHETLARDILIYGPLMTLGKELGEGRAFYAQPLYPYFLALLHGLFGEDQFGPVAVQVALLGFTCVTTWELSRRLFGRTTAWVTLILTLGFALGHMDAVSRRLLSESLYFLVLPLTLLLCVMAHQESGRRSALLAGVLMGTSVLTRGTTLLLLPISAAVLWRHRGIATALLLLVTATAVISLSPIRNAIVSGRPVLLATSGGVNMEKFHRPTDVVRLAGVDDNPVYNALNLDKPTREVLEFIRQDPLAYLQACLVLAAYTVGFGFALDEAQTKLFPDLIAYVSIYLLTVIMQPRSRSREALHLHAFIAVHFLAMVIFTPYDYENRLVLPMFLPMLSFVALGLVGTVSWLARWRPARSEPKAAPVPIRVSRADG